MKSTQITRIAVVQEGEAGALKISGIREYGRHIEIAEVITVPTGLPPLVDEPEAHLPEHFAGDLVLSFLRHPDLLDYLAAVCERQRIPLVASGRNCRYGHTPFTCCGLGRHQGLGHYGEQFGFPELDLRLDAHGRIAEIVVRRGASCGATWEAIPQILGLTPEEAVVAYPREVQYLCHADPSAFDPISGKSAVHHAGHVHHAALAKALQAQKKAGAP
ncbi:MAG: DUF166 family (seleno)protein DfsP [Thermodesulfobacteriota bacterium]